MQAKIRKKGETAFNGGFLLFNFLFNKEMWRAQTYMLEYRKKNGYNDPERSQISQQSDAKRYHTVEVKGFAISKD